MWVVVPFVIAWFLPLMVTPWIQEYGGRRRAEKVVLLTFVGLGLLAAVFGLLIPPGLKYKGGWDVGRPFPPIDNDRS